jgi:transcriptional regulator with XRE-family HTH domain
MERSPVSLGKYLASIRADRGFTLRQVEEGTNKEVSNAYLSQIENDKIKKPSPNVLHALAQLYGIDYEQLMEMAGYITNPRGEGEKHGRVATFAEHNPAASSTAPRHGTAIRHRLKIFWTLPGCRLRPAASSIPPALLLM